MKGEISVFKGEKSLPEAHICSGLTESQNRKPPQKALPSWHPQVFMLWTDNLTFNPPQIFNSVLEAHVKEK